MGSLIFSVVTCKKLFLRLNEVQTETNEREKEKSGKVF